MLVVDVNVVRSRAYGERLFIQIVAMFAEELVLKFDGRWNASGSDVADLAQLNDIAILEGMNPNFGPIRMQQIPFSTHPSFAFPVDKKPILVHFECASQLQVRVVLLLCPSVENGPGKQRLRNRNLPVELEFLRHFLVRPSSRLFSLLLVCLFPYLCSCSTTACHCPKKPTTTTTSKRGKDNKPGKHYFIVYGSDGRCL